jgi:hypothetical protein
MSGPDRSEFKNRTEQRNGPMHGGARVSVVFSVQVIQVTTRGRVDAVKVSESILNTNRE